MAEKLRIAVDNVVLEVNDNGDTITLPLADERFIQRVISYTQKMKDGAANLDGDNIDNIIGASIDYHSMLKENFNSVFGIDSYEKIFGEDIIVGVEYITEFLEQIMPYIETYQKKRATKLSKYSADRVGSM